jgi:pyroglutamyl-peptidase
MKLLLTAFNKFGALEFNPSEIIVNELAERMKLSAEVSLATEVLRTEFDAAGTRIQELIEEFQPDAIICLGVAVDRGVISLERVALNLIDTEIPDNAGRAESGKPIAPDGPTAYLSTLPLEMMFQQLKDLCIPVEISNHAGTYVCNDVFYLARHKIEQLGVPVKCGLIHIPQISGQTHRTKTDSLRMSASQVLMGIERCIRVLQEDSSSNRRSFQHSQSYADGL